MSLMNNSTTAHQHMKIDPLIINIYSEIKECALSLVICGNEGRCYETLILIFLLRLHAVQLLYFGCREIEKQCIQN